MPGSNLDLQSWWWGLLASIPVIGFWYKARMDLRAEILAAGAAAANAYVRAEEVRLELAEQRLDIQKEFVTHESLEKVTSDVKEDAKEREGRITDAINRIHKRLDTITGGVVGKFSGGR